MQKILKPLAAYIFAAFVVGMFALVISLTFSALGRIFPDNFANQLIGLVLFDISSVAWGLNFVYKSESVGQYAIAAIGFLVGLFGTIAMVASEVMLSASDLTAPPDWIGNALTYGFILAAVLHLVLGYAHVATSPEIDASIRLGATQAEITAEAMRQAEEQLESQRAALGDIIRPRLVAGVKRNLNLPVSLEETEALSAADEVIEAVPLSATEKAVKAEALSAAEEVIKANRKKQTKEQPAAIPALLWNAITGKRKQARKPQPVTTTYEHQTEAGKKKIDPKRQWPDGTPRYMPLEDDPTTTEDAGSNPAPFPLADEPDGAGSDIEGYSA